MKFTMAIPIGEIAPGEFQTQDAVREMSVALENFGIDACYVTDHPAPDAAWLHANGHDALDPFAAFGFVAASTSRLLMHTNILVMAYRNPFLTAKSAATLQTLSSGRLILGVGAGYQKSEFAALGVDFHKRGKLFDEALEVIRLAWAGGPVAFDGTTFTAIGNEPRPVPNPAPPIWIGGGSDKAIERAARFGDGWSPFFAAPTMSALNQESGIHTVGQLASKIAMLHDLRASLGNRASCDIAISAKASLRYQQAGGADEYCEAVHELAEAGVTWCMVDPPHPSRQAYIENVQWFGEEVVGRLV
jgi:probable F420-dependent oxidoreductase